MDCPVGNDFTSDHFGLRIGSVFVIFAVSAIGSFLPLLIMRSKLKVPYSLFFVFRYLGSGVIVATAFIHLMAESSEMLSDPCLGPPFTDYPFSSLFALLGAMIMFLFDMSAHRKLESKLAGHDDAQVHHIHNVGVSDLDHLQTQAAEIRPSIDDAESQISHRSRHTEQDSMHVMEDDKQDVHATAADQSFHLQMLNCFVLEFGIVFHSVFVGLSLAISGKEFVPLFIAVAFHQMFEGLGLGVRFALTKWPAHKQYTPWLLSLAYSFTTPIAMAVGLGVRNSYSQGSSTALLVNGVFDGLCGGILVYNGLVELMAYDFIVSKEFVGASNAKVMAAFGCLSVGAALMALLGRWA